MPRSETKGMTGYRFIVKDPAIDAYRAAKDRSGMKDSEISEHSGVSETTLRNWDFGKTRRPQHMTLRYAMAAMGYEEKWMGRNGMALDIHYPDVIKGKISDEEGT